MSEIFIPDTIDWDKQELLFERQDCEEDLYTFLKYSWKYIDSSPFVDGWPIEAVSEHLQAVVDGQIKRLIINIPPRCAKPVDGDALIPTYERGLIPLREVSVGTHVVTHKSRLRRVTHVHQQGCLPVLKLVTQRGREIIAAPDHPFLTVDGWKNLGDIRSGDVLAISTPSISLGSQTIPDEEARLLGYLVGDGSCQGTPNVTVADDIEAEDIARVADYCGFLPSVQSYKMASNGYVLRRISLKGGPAASKKKGDLGPAKQFLLKHGLYKKNSYTKMVPTAVLEGNNSVVTNFIGAYWACDGYVSLKGADRKDMIVGCDSVNKNFLLQMQTLLARLGINAILRQKTSNIKTKKQGDKYVSYTLVVSDQDGCARFARLINIKHAKSEKLIDFKSRRFDFDRDIVGDVVKEIVPCDDKECFCLTVEEDSTFVANGFVVHNSSLVSVAFPAWTWAQPIDTPTSGSGVQFLCASYAQQLTLRDSIKCRRLIESPWYQKLWGKRFGLVGDQNTKSRFANDKGGERLITSVGASVTGEGGDIILIDDPNAAQEAFSEATIASTIEWWEGAMSTRLNNPKTGCYIIIQQRLSEEDLTGHILSKQHQNWTHLCLPMKYEWQRHSITSIGWQDPRGLDDEGEPLVLVDENGTRLARDPEAYATLIHEREGALLWPERFDPETVLNLEAELGPSRAPGQLQQLPQPAGGGVIKLEWWEPWMEDKYPPMDFILASLDTAYTTKTENDFSALTIWGVFSTHSALQSTKMSTRTGMTQDGELIDSVSNLDPRTFSDHRPHVMLMYAWQKRLELHELVKEVAKTCKDMKVDKLLIENKAAGHSVAQEIRRLYSHEMFSVQLVDPKSTDKLSRLYSVQHLFAEGLIHAPEKMWSDEVIKQVGQFPKGKHDDLVDTVSMALRHLRDLGMLVRSEEAVADIKDSMLHKKQNLAPLYGI